MVSNPSPKVDKTFFSVVSLAEQGNENAFWHTKSAHERLQAIELIRQVVYGYEPAGGRVKRLFEVTDLEGSGVP